MKKSCGLFGAFHAFLPEKEETASSLKRSSWLTVKGDVHDIGKEYSCACSARMQ